MSAAPTIDVARVVAALPSAKAHRRGPSPTRAIPLPTGRFGASPAARAGHSPGPRIAGPRIAGWRIAAAALLMIGALGVVVGRGGQWPAAGGGAGTVAIRPAGAEAPMDGPARAGDSAMLAVVAGGQPLVDGTMFSLGGALSDLSDDA